MAEGGIIHLGNDDKILDISHWCPESFKEVGISFSGGIDSTALLCMLLEVYQPDSIQTFHYDHYATPVMYKIAAQLGIKNINILPPATAKNKAMEDACIHASDNTNIEAMYIGLDGNQVKDGWKSTFFNIGVRLPFASFTKQHTIDLIYKLNRGDILQHCYSCERNIEIPIHCGECSPCKSRIEGFKLLGIVDPTIYKNKEK